MYVFFLYISWISLNWPESMNPYTDPGLVERMDCINVLWSRAMVCRAGSPIALFLWKHPVMIPPPTWLAGHFFCQKISTLRFWNTSIFSWYQITNNMPSLLKTKTKWGIPFLFTPSKFPGKKYHWGWVHKCYGGRLCFPPYVLEWYEAGFPRPPSMWWY